jgi:hypothetical protein
VATIEVGFNRLIVLYCIEGNTGLLDGVNARTQLQNATPE